MHASFEISQKQPKVLLMPKTLLIIAHRPSPNTAALADAALAACQNYDDGDIETTLWNHNGGIYKTSPGFNNAIVGLSSANI